MLIAILGMMVIIGFVGNAGYIVTEKMNTQNAADAVAFSTRPVDGPRHERGHGHEPFARRSDRAHRGDRRSRRPRSRRRLRSLSAQSRITDSINQNFVNLAKINGLAVYGATAAGKIDGKFLDVVVNKFVSKRTRSTRPGPRFTTRSSHIKKSTAKRLIAKSIANAGLWVPPPWGWISAIAAYAVHIKMNLDLAKIGVEYVILEGLERIVSSDVIRKLKVNLIEQKLIQR